jgi:hypothetical protein
MRSLAWLALVIASAGCTRDADDRPRTLAYITEAILAPTCGKAECHSTFAQTEGDVFDTVVGARYTIVHDPLVTIPNDELAPTGSQLYQSITIGLPSLEGLSGKIRMPYDAPMPNEDVYLIESWIAGGADGAQCIPDTGYVCNGNNLVACTADGNYGELQMTCSGTCSSGACL